MGHKQAVAGATDDAQSLGCVFQVVPVWYKGASVT